jgi:Holliday junction resolvase RusA-like endonuclease
MAEDVAVLSFWVPGIAKTKGSMKSGSQGQMWQSVKGSTQWAKIVESAARKAVADHGWEVATGRVAVVLEFYLPGDPLAKGAGDGDKLERNVFDALTKARVWVDDVQVVECHWKREVIGEARAAIVPGVFITVTSY